MLRLRQRQRRRAGDHRGGGGRQRRPRPLLRGRRRRWSGCGADPRDLRGAARRRSISSRPAPRRTRSRSPASARPGRRSTATARRTSTVDECGAPEFYTGGAKLTLLDGDARAHRPRGRSRGRSARPRETGVHNVQRGALTLTNATEAGTVYDARRRWPALAGIAAGGAGCRSTWTGRASPTRSPPSAARPAEADLEGGGRRPLLRRHQERLPRRRGGRPLRSGARLGVRAPAQARRAPLLQAPLPLGADGGLSRGRPLARPGEARERPGARARARDRGAARRGAGPPGRGQRGLRRLAARGALGGAGGGGALLPLAGDQSLEGPGAEPLAARFVCNWATTAEEVAALVGAFAAAGVGAAD